MWLYQIFAFFMPALSRTEKQYTFGFFFTAVPLFLAGCAAGWYVLPHVVELMTSFAPPDDAAFINAKDYFQFVLKLVLAIGIAFVLPVFLVLLNFAGVISATSIIGSWRWAILVIVPVHRHRHSGRRRRVDVPAGDSDGRAVLRGLGHRLAARSSRRTARAGVRGRARALSTAHDLG